MFEKTLVTIKIHNKILLPYKQKYAKMKLQKLEKHDVMLCFLFTLSLAENCKSKNL
jgi:hypothetical protein